MISLLNDAPENVAAFSASGDISLTDFENIIIPHVEKKMERFNELNYLLYLNRDLPKTDVDVWLVQSLLKLQIVIILQHGKSNCTYGFGYVFCFL